jgi:hypothetical protein
MLVAIAHGDDRMQHDDDPRRTDRLNTLPTPSQRPTVRPSHHPSWTTESPSGSSAMRHRVHDHDPPVRTASHSHGDGYRFGAGAYRSQHDVRDFHDDHSQTVISSVPSTVVFRRSRSSTATTVTGPYSVAKTGLQRLAVRRRPVDEGEPVPQRAVEGCDAFEGRERRGIGGSRLARGGEGDGIGGANDSAIHRSGSGLPSGTLRAGDVAVGTARHRPSAFASGGPSSTGSSSNTGFVHEHPAPSALFGAPQDLEIERFRTNSGAPAGSGGGGNSLNHGESPAWARSSQARQGVRETCTVICRAWS